MELLESSPEAYHVASAFRFRSWDLWSFKNEVTTIRLSRGYLALRGDTEKGGLLFCTGVMVDRCVRNFTKQQRHNNQNKEGIVASSRVRKQNSNKTTMKIHAAFVASVLSLSVSVVLGADVARVSRSAANDVSF